MSLWSSNFWNFYYTLGSIHLWFYSRNFLFIFLQLLGDRQFGIGTEKRKTCQQMALSKGNFTSKYKFELFVFEGVCITHLLICYIFVHKCCLKSMTNQGAIIFNCAVFNKLTVAILSEDRNRFLHFMIYTVVLCSVASVCCGFFFLFLFSREVISKLKVYNI